MKMQRHEAENEVETKADLDKWECECCDKDAQEIYIGPDCHIGAPLEVSYVKGSGVLCVRCAECYEIVTKIAVADPIARN